MLSLMKSKSPGAWKMLYLNQIGLVYRVFRAAIPGAKA
jgi:hypothetical protein